MCQNLSQFERGELDQPSMFSVEWPICKPSINESIYEKEEGQSDVMVKLQELKKQVPLVIRNVGRRRWEAAIPNPSVPISMPTSSKVISRAYFKLFEIMKSCCIPTPSNSLHLCEAPGGFVQCIAELTRDKEWTWKAVTLLSTSTPQIATEGLPFDKGCFMVLPNQGDVTTKECVDAIVGHYSDETVKRPDLVTSDGAIEMDHDSLEFQHLELFRAEANIAIQCIDLGGCFVCKFFEGGLSETRFLVACIASRFESTSIIKPFSSRPTNSERYLVARKFTGDRTILPTQGALPYKWKQDFNKITDRLAQDQHDSLKSVFATLQQRLPSRS